MSPPGQQGGSRLQKLLRLIDGGPSPDTRHAAAHQITSIAASHPTQLPAVLAQVSVHLKHKDWDARVAAARCLGLLAEHFVHPTAADLRRAAGPGGAQPPPAQHAQQEVKAEPGAIEDEDAVELHMLTFSSFKVGQVLEQGTPLLASWGQEYDAGGEAGRDLAKQRQNLKKRLGLGGPMDSLVDTADMIEDEDLLAVGAAPAKGRAGRGGTKPGGPPAQPQKEAAQLLADMSGLSARERAAALRRAKSSLKRGASGVPGGLAAPDPGSPSKRAKLEGSAGAQGSEAEAGAAAGLTAEEEWREILSGRWPFQRLCDQLCMDVLHPQWEVRHGAAAALREVLTAQAGAAGVHAPLSDDPSGWAVAGGSGKRAVGAVSATDAAAAEATNARWLEDCAIHLLCVLALDRFGDFVSDQVVAPVRETAAQALGAATRPLPLDTLRAMLASLRQLSECSEWEVRHGGLLGLKYVLAARGGSAASEEQSAGGAELLQAVLPAALVGLQDSDDDVRAVAAEALLPVAPQLAADPSPAAHSVRQLLWDILLMLEDLSPATASVMQLLAQMYSAAGSLAGGSAAEALGPMVPRLWPFLRHSLTSVRLAAVRCLAALLRGSSGTSDGLLRGAELVRALRLLFQNLLLERSGEVLGESQEAWRLLLHSRPAAALQQDLAAATAATAGEAAAPFDVLGALCQLASTPTNRALSAALMLSVPPPAAAVKGSAATLTSKQQAAGAAAVAGAAQGQSQSLVVGEGGDTAQATRMRLAAARALGQLAHVLANSDGSPNPLLPHLLNCLRGATASGRLLGSYSVTCWAQEQQQQQQQGQGGAAAAALPAGLQQVLPVLLELLSAPAPAPYSELVPLYAQLRNQASAVVARGVAAGVPLALPVPLEVLGAEAALALAAQVPPGSAQELEAARGALASTAGVVSSSEAFLATGVTAALAVGVVTLGALPPKLNAVIQPLVAAVRREPEPLLQDQAAAGLARLCILCAQRTPSPNDKIIKNVCTFACGDPAATPSVAQPPSLEAEEVGPSEGGNGAGSAKGGKAGTASGAPTQDQPQQDLGAQALALARRGGEATLQQMARQAGPALLETLPKLWDQVAAPLAAAAQQQPATAAAPADGAAGAAAAAQLQPAVNALHVLKVVGPEMHPDLLPHMLPLLPLVSICVQHPNPALQLAAACCLAALAAAHTQQLMPPLLRLLTPLLAGGASEASRVGALVAARQLVRALGLRLVPYALLLVVPLIGRMSDASPLARSLASAAFASVVAIMPLMDRSLPPPPGLDEAQLATWQAEGGFLQQLLDNSAAEDYQLPIVINGTLRRYQQEGINWLAFLRRFGLHGVLADDMGLGKTLQATCIMGAATKEQRRKFAETGSPADAPRPSLIVCPSTLVAHWAYEVAKFVGGQPGALRPLQYAGNPGERAALRQQLATHDVVVMAYESLRADVDWVSGVQWGYCVLDEGHAIRNPTSKVTQACKRVQAQHRLILSGTPIQNNVLELWSLFDFLMPGFLGSERQFNAKFGRAVQTAKASATKKGSGNAAAGVLALEGLHRQVMPFILRRTKDQVLKDLPPKIIQDVLCEPSVLQRALYEDFASSQALQAVTGVVAGGLAGAEADKAPHVFQALHYLRKLCSHPLLVLDPAQPQHAAAVEHALGHPHHHRSMGEGGGAGHGGSVDWDWARGQLHAHLQHAPKLLALRELLLDCGIGREPGVKGEESGFGEDGNGGAGHRVLVFAQLRALLDLVEADVLGPLGASFLRIDGGVDSAERFRRVQQFNSDPTIDVMLLTTQVGGLGLNLTAADTVIFLEHDWNPMKDLQAMDRAHRLGQRRTVNVYRLLVRGTLEEQIMSLQEFKKDVATTLVNQDNVSLGAMDTSNLLDLFGDAKEGAQQAAQQAAADRGKRGGLAAVLESLGDVAQNEEQYAQEFSLESFQQRMQK